MVQSIWTPAQGTNPSTQQTDSRLYRFAQKIGLAPETLPITRITLHRIMPHALRVYLDPLNFAMARYNISTGRRVAGFLSQLAVESDEIRHTRERWTTKQDFKLGGVSREAHTAISKEDYFMYWYGKRPDLGNDTAEDGYTYRGRGAIQITGKKNYIEIGLKIGQPLETQPDLLETNRCIDMLASACFFAQLKHLNAVADGVDPNSALSIREVNKRLTKAVNGGYNAESERLTYFKKALRTLGIPALIPTDYKRGNGHMLV